MLQERTRLNKILVSRMGQKDLLGDNRYKERLRREIKEIDAQGEHDYFLNLYDQGVRFPENEHNLLVDYLLDLAPDFDIDRETDWVQGEYPDVDVDFIKPVRDYLKREWAAEVFGQDKICEIGTYGTSGIKSAILDMASVHGVSKHEIQSITVQMEDKDADGNPIDWERIFQIAKEERERQEKNRKNNKTVAQDSVYLKFAKWCNDNPEVAKAAELLINRNRTGGVHAGGLIISDRSIDGFVPLEVRSVNKANPFGVICSAWTEGLNRSDLGPVGLIKFDLLVINNLMQIALACDLVKKRHGLTSISADDSGWDWSDISYLNDLKSLEMANKGDMKCIFQFDSEGIRKLVKRGGVTSFDDLAAYSAIYRPGPLNCFSVQSKIKIRGGEKTVKELKNWYDEIAYINTDGKISYSKKFAIWKTGKKKIIKIRTKSGKILMVSPDHPILSEGGKFKKSQILKIGEKIAVSKL